MLVPIITEAAKEIEQLATVCVPQAIRHPVEDRHRHRT
jgi:hypothetical protein